jgi:hypothetical protein
VKIIATLMFAAAAFASLASAQNANLIVTVEGHHNKPAPTVTKPDVMVYSGKDRLTVTDWIPLRGDHAALEFFIVIDDAVSLGSQLQDLRAFIEAQPATTAVGLAYMRNGGVQVEQDLTRDHALAAKKVRLPLGSIGASASPYFSLDDLVKRWPASPVRHEVLMISDGIDRFGGVGPSNPYVDASIEHAQRAGVVVYAIYASGLGHFGHSLYRLNWGQSYLSELADKTGGEAYFQGFDTPISLTPFLDEISKRLEQQYLLTFVPKSDKKGLERIKLQTEIPGAELVAAENIYVQGDKK